MKVSPIGPAMAGAFFSLALALGPAPISPAQPGEPSMALDASTVEAGGSLHATGNCGSFFSSSTVVHIHVYRLTSQEPAGPFEFSAEATVSSDGSFHLTIAVPADALPGHYRAALSCLVDDIDNVGSELAVEVRASSSTPTPPPQTLHLTGRERPKHAPPAAEPVQAQPSFTG